jgi:hypothetical protein
MRQKRNIVISKEQFDKLIADVKASLSQSTNNNTQEELLSLSDASKYTSKGVNILSYLSANGKLKSYSFKNKMAFLKRDLDQLIKNDMEEQK